MALSKKHRKYLSQLDIDLATFHGIQWWVAVAGTPYSYCIYDPDMVNWDVPLTHCDWKHSKYEVSATRMLRHLLYDGIIVGTDRCIVNPVTGAIDQTPLLIIDIDCHSPAARVGRDELYRWLQEILGDIPFLVFRSSHNGGLHIYISIEPTDLYRLNGHGPNSVESLLQRAMPDTGARLEVFPRANTPLRLPLGYGSYLLDPKDLSVFEDHVGRAMEYVVNWFETTTPIPLERLTSRLQAMKRCHKPSPPMTCPKPGHKPSGVDFISECERLERDGLPGPDTRWEVTKKMMFYFCVVRNPGSAEKLADLYWEWLSTHHNGYSDAINRNFREAGKWARTAATQFWETFGQNLSPYMSPIPAGLSETDLTAIIDLLDRRPDEFALYQAPGKDLQFLHDLPAYAKGQILRLGLDIGQSEHQVPVPRAAWTTFGPANRNRESAYYYERYKAMLADMGVVEPVPTHIGRGQCRLYTVHFQYCDPTSDVPVNPENIPDHLVRIVGRKKAEDILNSKPLRRAKELKISHAAVVSNWNNRRNNIFYAPRPSLITIVGHNK